MSLESRVCALIADVLQIEAQAVDGTSDMESVQAWDSLQHLAIVTALEEEFGCSFAPEQIAELNSVSRIVAAVSAAE